MDETRQLLAKLQDELVHLDERVKELDQQVKALSERQQAMKISWLVTDYVFSDIRREFIREIPWYLAYYVGMLFFG